ncbi:MAG: hypothetical protein ABSF26_26500 [Thermoguttaceae bacterium]|jgi:hypothetical protein
MIGNGIRIRPLPTVIARAAIFRKRFLAGIAIGKATVPNTEESGAGRAATGETV